ncbi:EF-hand, partial [Ascoidea rubescens DSM 1968]
FNRVDRDKNGVLNLYELQTALHNDDSSAFKISTIKTLIKNFVPQKEIDYLIDFEDFKKLYKEIITWRNIFKQFDLDNSFTIDFSEFVSSIEKIGFSLPENLNRFIFNKFSYKNPSSLNNEMKFDSFVESILLIISLTKTFVKYRTQEDFNYAKISYPDFLEEFVKLIA